MSSDDEYMIRHAGQRASQLVGSGLFKPQDWEDLRQELVVDCWRRRGKFNSKLSEWQGFVRGVMKNHAAVLVSRRQRNVRREVLADDLAQTVPADESHRVRRLEDLQKYEVAATLQVGLDTQQVLSTLPPRLKNIAMQLSECSVMEICARTGRSRSGIYASIRQLRSAFEKGGFELKYPQRSVV